MPRRLVEYAVCHELRHLKVPTHNRLYRLLLGQHIPDWQERERELGCRVMANRKTEQFASVREANLQDSSGRNEVTSTKL